MFNKVGAAYIPDGGVFSVFRLGLDRQPSRKRGLGGCRSAGVHSGFRGSRRLAAAPEMTLTILMTLNAL
jgi:hypothetical protein